MTRSRVSARAIARISLSSICSFSLTVRARGCLLLLIWPMFFGHLECFPVFRLCKFKPRTRCIRVEKRGKKIVVPILLFALVKMMPLTADNQVRQYCSRPSATRATGWPSRFAARLPRRIVHSKQLTDSAASSRRRLFNSSCAVVTKLKLAGSYRSDGSRPFCLLPRQQVRTPVRLVPPALHAEPQVSLCHRVPLPCDGIPSHFLHQMDVWLMERRAHQCQSLAQTSSRWGRSWLPSRHW